MRWLATMVAFLPAGCASVGPPTWTGAPPVTGTLHHAGAPIAGTRVRLVGGLDAATAEAVTDAEGRFSIGPLGKKGHAAHVGFFGIGESVARWKIEFQREGRWLTGWESSGGIGYAPRDTVEADCDTARPASASDIAGRGTDGAGFCRLALAAH